MQTSLSNNERPRNLTHTCHAGIWCRREAATTFYPISGATWIRLGQRPYRERLPPVDATGNMARNLSFTMIDSTLVFDDNF